MGVFRKEIFSRKTHKKMVKFLLPLLTGLVTSWVVEIPILEEETTQSPQPKPKCLWVAGQYSQRIHCPDSHIATGQCNSAYRPECQDKNGLLLGCPKEHSIFGVCTSGKDGKPDCHHEDKNGKDHVVYDEIQCCKKEDVHVNDHDCHWHSGPWGANVSCRENEVLHAMCGSGHAQNEPQQCHGDGNHIGCCSFHVGDKP